MPKKQESKLKIAARKTRAMQRKIKINWLFEHDVLAKAPALGEIIYDNWLDDAVRVNGGDPEELERRATDELVRRLTDESAT